MSINSFLDEKRVVQRQSVIELKSIYGLSKLRDIWVGDVTSDVSGFTLTAASDGTQNAMLRTAERGPYPPGREVEPGQGFIMDQVPTGNQVVYMGYYDDNDGWFLLFDSVGMHTVVRKNGTDYAEQWGTWDGDELVGNPTYDGVTDPNSSGSFRFKPSDGYIFQFPFTWYGFGPTEFNIQLTKRWNGKWMKTLATRRPIGETSINQPHLPIRCDVITQSGDGAFSCKVTGRQISVVGDYNPIYRETTAEVINNDAVTETAWTPVIAFKRKAITPYATTHIDDIDIICDDPVRVMIMQFEPEDVSGTFVDFPFIPSSETLLENLIDPTADENNGILLKEFIAKSGGDSPDKKRFSRMPFIEDKPMVLFCRKIPGQGVSANVTLDVSLREDW